ncbi:MAG: tripartite tricarboxylate transporter TctB family protein [Syntrophorhabdaceae bacterium]|nr:tripartite tricarboxylate transporter TctB family protein [Syntrophorhabdaceae bacterium]
MNADKAGGLFWLSVAVVVSYASYRLGIGSFSSPGAGFMPFYAAIFLGVLSLISILGKAGGVKKEKGAPPIIGIKGIKGAFIFVVLMAYGFFIPFLGYNITTFLLMVILFFIVEKQKVWKAALYAFIATATTYYVFSKWLNCQFPLGPLGF